MGNINNITTAPRPKPLRRDSGADDEVFDLGELQEELKNLDQKKRERKDGLKKAEKEPILRIRKQIKPGKLCLDDPEACWEMCKTQRYKNCYKIFKKLNEKDEDVLKPN